MIKYCVKTGTSILVEGSDNPTETIVQNATDRGFSESEIEIVTEEEYLARKALEPKPINPPTVEERIASTEEAILILMEVLGNV